MAIAIEVETVPFQAEPEVRFNITVRRWVSSEVKKFVENHAVSVYFRNPLAWGKAIDSGKNTGYFQVAPLIWQGEYRWDGNLLPLLEQFNPLSLKPAEICADPVKALNLKGDRNIALTHADGTYPAHRIGKGWFTEDCRQITEQIIELLQADTSQNYPDGVVVDTCYFREEDLAVTLLKIEARGIPSALALRSDKKPNEREILAAFKRRQEEISQRIRELPEVPKIAERGAILEIAGQDQWEKSWLDPYRICRAAFASEGRLLQYITQEHERVPKNEGDKIGIVRAKETLNFRATSSVQEVLRALGVQAVPPKIVFKGAGQYCGWSNRRVPQAPRQ